MAVRDNTMMHFQPSPMSPFIVQPVSPSLAPLSETERAYHPSSSEPRLPSAVDPGPSSYPSSSAILPSQKTYYRSIAEDVPILNDAPASASASPSSPAIHYPRTPLESQPLPSFSSPHHGSLNSQTARQSTSHFPVIQSSSDLAAHHGIPRKLPPTPRIPSNTTTSTTKPPVPLFDGSIPESPSTLPLPNNHVHSLISNYLEMLSRKPEEPTASPSPARSTMALPPDYDFMTHPDAVMGDAADARAAQAILDMLAGNATDFNEYLTSPLDESPIDNPLDTPAQLGSTDVDFLTSPNLDVQLFPDSAYSDLALFGDDPVMEMAKMSMQAPPPLPQTGTPMLDGLLPISPYTPNLDSMSLMASPQIDAPLEEESSGQRATRSSRNRPNGTRKNITPEALVPFDAPTQPRTYHGASATSKKELPAVFARKRARSQAFGDEEDELGEEEALTGNPTTSEAAAIEAKRRQNTLAARRSRKRKLEYQRQLEDSIDAERREKEMWKERAMLCQAQLRAVGIQVPFGDDG